MRRVINAEGTSDIRPFGGESPNGSAISGRSPTQEREDSELERLSRENSLLKEQLRELAASTEQAAKAAREEGRREGKAEFARDDEARLRALRAGIESALENWERRLEGLENLAALLSKHALAKLFEQPGDRADLVLECLAGRLRLMDQQTIIAVRVSASDFADDSKLTQVTAGEGRVVPISAVTELGTGECRIDLKVGHIDIGPATQWRRLSALLDEIGEGTKA